MTVSYTHLDVYKRQALVSHTKHYFVLKEGHIAKLTKDEIIVKDENGEVYGPYIHHISWDMASAKKGGYDYFMMKEIHEQPEALRNTIRPRMVNGLPDFSADGVGDELFTDVNRIVITACGTAMHSGLMGKNMIERLCRIPVTVDIASEFRYQNPIIDEHTLLITVSQSGETADTLAALRLAKERLSLIHILWALKLPVPHTDVLKTHEPQNFSAGITRSQRNWQQTFDLNQPSSLSLCQ